MVTEPPRLAAVVTGGNQGIGLALATGIARTGAPVAIWARNAERNVGAVEKIVGEGGTAMAVPCDITDEDSVAAAMEETVERFGPLGAFVANAGIADASPFVDTTLEEWRNVLATNLDGTFLCAREAARRFVAQGRGGSILVVSSMVSRYGATGQAAYAVSKSGLSGLGRTLAVELARHGVRCNILIPGWTRTAMNDHLQAEPRFMAATTARTPVRRWADPSEFEALAAFLVDPALTFHTGNEVVVDGGYSVF